MDDVPHIPVVESRDNLHYEIENGSPKLEAAVDEPKAKVDVVRPVKDIEVGITASERRRALSYSAVSPDDSPVVLTFKDLKVSTKTSPPKVLLNSVSGSIVGGFWAIMGASGGGKTTLLSTLSLRLDPKKMNIEGEIRLNGHEYSREDLKAMSAYVMQDDVLHAEFTCEETLRYASKLRLPARFSDGECESRVKEVIDLMGIEHCSGVIVGDSRRKGISGGERKRLCVAIELLSKPKLLFLDEPTSGLDSSTASTLCTALKNIADSGAATVICTIHQPQQKIFNSFDNLLLLKRGNIVFLGACEKSVLFLEAIGLPCPPGTNPADHLIDVISPSKDDSILQDGLRNVPISLDLGNEKEFNFMRDGASWMTQFYTLIGRNLKQYLRRSDVILLNAVSTALVAIFIGAGIWFKILSKPSPSTTVPPSLFFGCVTQGIFASLQCVNTFPGERAVMLRERQAGSYYVSSYFCAKTIVDMVTNLWPPILFTCIAYPMIGYQNAPDKFFIYMAFMILDNMAAVSLAIAVSTICISVERSTVVLSFVFEICRLYGGFFTSPAQLLDSPQWKFADALSYIKYVFVGVAINELSGLEFQCPKTGTCVKTGEAVMKEKGYDQYTIGYCAGILIVYIVGARILGYLGLRFIKA